MKTRTLLVLLCSMLTACGPSTEEVVVGTWPDGSAKDIYHYIIEGADSTLVRQVSFYESGQKRQEGGFVDGCRDGKWKYWYDDGTLWVEGFFEKGARSGPVKYYYPNGSRHSVGNYDNGIRIGTWRFWDEQGEELKEIDYDRR